MLGVSANVFDGGADAVEGYGTDAEILRLIMFLEQLG